MAAKKGRVREQPKPEKLTPKEARLRLFEACQSFFGEASVFGT